MKFISTAAISTATVYFYCLKLLQHSNVKVSVCLKKYQVFTDGKPQKKNVEMLVEVFFILQHSEVRGRSFKTDLLCWFFLAPSNFFFSRSKTSRN